jgi:hypothetical protein
MGTLQEFENDRLANRSKVEVQVGGFTLRLDPTYMLFNVFRPDGKAIPKGLQGKWKEVSDFRQAAEKILGPDYSVEGLRTKGKDKAVEAAVNVGLDPKKLKLDEDE